ncbi:GNAT family N-acetyltransferase [Paenibacillus sp. GCM10012306]|uniref:GNAT family N-acetyltransferase n=1 Tax=Paenibacillus sp. GCM10012306 TaxID=3317342 RepID=UPI00360A19B5
MLIDLTPRIGTPEVNELLEYAVIGEPEALQQTSEEYRNSSGLQLFGWEEEELLLGLVGFEETEDGSLDIRHIAVLPENRGKGYARGMILELLTAREPRYLLAETEDEIAADFYRALGFMVYSLGVNAAGIEMFRCVYEVEEFEDEE